MVAVDASALRSQALARGRRADRSALLCAPRADAAPRVAGGRLVPATLRTPLLAPACQPLATSVGRRAVLEVEARVLEAGARPYLAGNDGSRAAGGPRVPLGTGYRPS